MVWESNMRSFLIIAFALFAFGAVLTLESTTASAAVCADGAFAPAAPGHAARSSFANQPRFARPSSSTVWPSAVAPEPILIHANSDRCGPISWRSDRCVP